MTAFTLDDNILLNIGQAWNFFGMMCCKNMKVYDKYLLGELPNGIFLKYSPFHVDDLYLQTYYNSTSFKNNAIIAIKHHLNLELEESDIVDFRCGNNGMVVIVTKLFARFTLELSGQKYV